MKSRVAKIRRVSWELSKKLLGSTISLCPQPWHSQQLPSPNLRRRLGVFFPWRESLDYETIGRIKGRSSLQKGKFKWKHIWMVNPPPTWALFYSYSRRMENKPLLKLPAEFWKSSLKESEQPKGKGYWYWNSPNEVSNSSSYKEMHTRQASLILRAFLAVFSLTYLKLSRKCVSSSLK